MGGGPGCNTRELTDRLFRLKDELVEFDAKELELDQHLTWARQSFVNMVDDPDNKRFAYVTDRDMCKPSVTTNSDTHMTIVIQAPAGTNMNVETISQSDLIKLEEEDGVTVLDEDDEDFIGDDDGIIFDEPMQVDHSTAKTNATTGSGGNNVDEGIVKEEILDEDCEIQISSNLQPNHKVGFLRDFAFCNLSLIVQRCCHVSFDLFILLTRFLFFIDS